MKPPTRPITRYFGGKWRTGPWIIEHFPPHRVYVEPYGGAGSVLLQKPRVYAEIYNDLDDEMVNLFEVMRDRGPELEAKIRLTPYARRVFVQAYQPTDDPLERARRTIVKAYMGFGSNAIQVDHARDRGFRTRVSTEPPLRTGFQTRMHAHRKPQTGFRADSMRSGTTPAADWRNYADAMHGIVARLQGVVIENRPALEVIQRFDRDDTLTYCDPPYPHGTRQNIHKDKYRHEMTNDEHRELATVLHACKGMVVVSGYACDLYDNELFPTWMRVSRSTRADRQRKATEVIWINPAAARRLQPTLFDG